MQYTDALLSRLQGEADERQQFMDGLVEAAEKESRDLNEGEMELYTRARERLTAINAQMAPLSEGARIARESRDRAADLARQFTDARNPARRPMEYRSAGEYVIDVWRAGLGHADAAERLELFTRAAAHQTTTDNPGLLPEQILGPVVSFVDSGRPIVNALGPRQLPAGSWSRPSVTQHTTVAPQTGEKQELVSQKMVIGKVPVAAKTYGGYVNVSRQDVDWTQPGIMDILINDLAGAYAVETENATADDLVAASTAGPTIPTGTPDAADIAGAFWTAAGAVYEAVKGQGRLIAVTGTDMLGMLGPIFPPINPQDAQSQGFSASGFGTGAAGSVAGIPVYVSAGMAANTILVLSTVAAEVYEDRIGALQVVEPSVLGIQVAYAGYFANLTMSPEGIVKIVKTP